MFHRTAFRAFVCGKLKKYLDDVDCLVETLADLFMSEMGTETEAKKLNDNARVSLLFSQ